MATAQIKHDYHLVNPEFVANHRLDLGPLHGRRRHHLDAPFVFRRADHFRDRRFPRALHHGGLVVDVIKAQYEGDHTRVVQLSLRYGMILFIASEVMFFVAWFWAFFNSALFPATHHSALGWPSTAWHWPPAGIVPSIPAPAAAQHADPADLRHHRDLGASRADRGDRKGLTTGWS